MPTSQAINDAQPRRCDCTVSSHSSARGFTLFETLIVLVILALAVGIVSSQWTSLDARPKNVGQAIATALRSARAEALRSNEDVSLTFDLSAHTVSRSGKLVAQWPADFNLAIEASESESSGNRYGVRFLGEGGSTGLRIAIAAEGAERSSVTVSWLTGEVRSQLGADSAWH